jgi:hypothetical protein
MWISRRNLLKGLSVAALGSIFPTPTIETLPGVSDAAAQSLPVLSEGFG